jgi:hypothetical protein
VCFVPSSNVTSLKPCCLTATPPGWLAYPINVVSFGSSVMLVHVAVFASTLAHAGSFTTGPNQPAAVNGTEAWIVRAVTALEQYS